MKKRFLLILFLIISLPIVFAECDEKRGGVKIEDKCYDCGTPDKVCPKDFGADCKIIDPDCNFISSIFVNIIEWIKGLFK